MGVKINHQILGGGQVRRELQLIITLMDKQQRLQQASVLSITYPVTGDNTTALSSSNICSHTHTHTHTLREHPRTRQRVLHCSGIAAKWIIVPKSTKPLPQLCCWCHIKLDWTGQLRGRARTQNTTTGLQRVNFNVTLTQGSL